MENDREYKQVCNVCYGRYYDVYEVSTGTGIELWCKDCRNLSGYCETCGKNWEISEMDDEITCKDCKKICKKELDKE